MSMKKLGAAVVVALALTACGTAPQQTVYGTRAAFVGSLQVATAYGDLPLCKPASPPLCHDAAVLKKVQKHAHVADAALDTAEEAVRNPQFGQDAAQSAVIAANAAVKALQAVTSQLKVR